MKKGTGETQESRSRDVEETLFTAMRMVRDRFAQWKVKGNIQVSKEVVLIISTFRIAR